MKIEFVRCLGKLRRLCTSQNRFRYALLQNSLTVPNKALQNQLKKQKNTVHQRPYCSWLLEISYRTYRDVGHPCGAKMIPEEISDGSLPLDCVGLPRGAPSLESLSMPKTPCGHLGVRWMLNSDRHGCSSFCCCFLYLLRIGTKLLIVLGSMDA